MTCGVNQLPISKLQILKELVTEPLCFVQCSDSSTSRTSTAPEDESKPSSSVLRPSSFIDIPTVVAQGSKYRQRHIRLSNRRLTCFVNVVFQVLSHVPALWTMSIEEAHTALCGLRKNGVFCHMCLLFDQMKAVFQARLPKDHASIGAGGSHMGAGNKIVVLERLYNHLGSFDKKFKLGKESDAIDFFRALVDKCIGSEVYSWILSGEAGVGASGGSGQGLGPTGREAAERASHPLRPMTVFHQLFGTETRNRIYCSSCKGHPKDENSPVLYIDYPVQISRRTLYESLAESLGNYHKATGSASRDQASRDTIADQRGIVVDGYRCELCKKKGEGRLVSWISRLPPFLVVSLQREDPMAQFAFGGRSKSQKRVHIDESMDLKDLVECGSEPVGLGSLGSESTRYELVAVICHLGFRSNTGHYVTYCRDESDGSVWRRFDDEDVSVVSLGKNLRSGVKHPRPGMMDGGIADEWDTSGYMAMYRQCVAVQPRHQNELARNQIQSQSQTSTGSTSLADLRNPTVSFSEGPLTPSTAPHSPMDGAPAVLLPSNTRDSSPTGVSGQEDGDSILDYCDYEPQLAFRNALRLSWVKKSRISRLRHMSKVARVIRKASQVV